MLRDILGLLVAVDSGATISLLNGKPDEELAAVLRQGKKALTEAQLLIELLAQLMGVDLLARGG